MSRKIFPFRNIIKKFHRCCFYGDIRRLGEEYGKFYSTNNLEVINYEESCLEEDAYKDFWHLIIYEKQKEKFVPKKIIVLLKNKINDNEVNYVTGKHYFIEYGSPYCEFNFESMIKLKEDEYIFSLESKIEEERDQEYYYITDTKYKNEIIYYQLNIKEDNKIDYEIISTDKKSTLLKNEQDIFYFLYNESESNVGELETFFDDNKMKINLIKFRSKVEGNFFIKNNTVIGWDQQFIYVSKVFDNKLEIVNFIKLNNIKPDLIFIITIIIFIIIFIITLII